MKRIMGSDVSGVRLKGTTDTALFTNYAGAGTDTLSNWCQAANFISILCHT